MNLEYILEVEFTGYTCRKDGNRTNRKDNAKIFGDQQVDMGPSTQIGKDRRGTCPLGRGE